MATERLNLRKTKNQLLKIYKGDKAEACLQGTMKGTRRRGRQKKRWKDNIKEWTGVGFGDSQRAAEDREGWKGIVAKSSVPRRPPKVRD